MEKTKLRLLLRRRLRSVAAAELATASQAITERLKAEIDCHTVKRFCVYESVESWREPDMVDFVSWVKESYAKVEITLLSQASNTVFPTENFDAIIVPLLGFDDLCARLGRGSGWYDRFLSEQPKASKIGVALENQHVSHLPVEEHDIALDMIVTEQTVYRKHG